MNILWTDGSSGKSGKIGWAVIGQLEYHDEPVRLYGHGVGTNQSAELTAVVEALRLIPDQVAVTIMTDSQYAIKSATEWRSAWEQFNYVNCQGNQIKNLHIILELHAHCDRVNVKFVHVRGHTGDEGNELADALAHLARKVMEGKVDPEALQGYNLIKSYGHQEANHQDQTSGSSKTEDSGGTT